MSFLELQGLFKRYGAVAALDGIEMIVPGGSRTAIVGPSGCGKTTLLRVIAGFDAPDAGRVVLDGKVLADGPDSVPAHRRGIGFVAQDGALFPHLSVADNIGFGLDRNDAGRAARIAELAGMAGLSASALRRRPHELSGGQQQRVALARALARKPRLMLLDEPFSALDTGLRASMRKAVAEMLEAAGITTLLVTHDQAEALSFADQVAVMRDGKFSQVGSPRELYLRPANPMVAAFLGDSIVLPAILADGWAECSLGRIAVDAASRGAAKIMLRPEQVALEPVPAGLSADFAKPGYAFGEVVDVDFGGSVCNMSVRLLRVPEVDGEAAGTLQLRKSSVDVLAAGSLVRIVVAGTAHVFSGQAI